MDRSLPPDTAEGEIALVIDYRPGQSRALDVLGGAMALVAAIDALDAALLSSISTELEPVSVLNDVQHSSLKILLQRVLRSLPDDHMGSLEWKKWLGSLLVKGKYLLLGKLDADAPILEAELRGIEADYRSAPGGLVGYEPPKVSEVRSALREVARARASLDEPRVVVQTELGDIELGAPPLPPQDDSAAGQIVTTLVNRGREFLKVRYPDMLGHAQWTVMRNGRSTRVELLHERWLQAYHERRLTILPGDSLDCSFEESIGYDAQRNEVERKISVIEVHGVITPPTQARLDFQTPP